MTEKKSMLCPNCRRLISNDEPACPYCGMTRPGALWKRTVSGALSLQRLNPVTAILGANILFFVLSFLIDPKGLNVSANPLMFLSPSSDSLFILGATGTIPLAYGRWWTLISAGFLHGGILHIFFNMMAFRQLAPFILDEFGLNRFAILYVWTGVAGFLLSGLAGVPFTIGASASICGMIGAILYYSKSRGGSYGNAIFQQAMSWVMGLVLFGLFLPGINNWAHGGGIVSGILIAFLIGYRDRKPESWTHRLLGTGSILLTAAVLLWAVIQAFLLTGQ
jgi:rhomboid protease GluP